MNISKVRSFIGLCNVYGCLVRNFARPVALLNKKIKETESFRLELDIVVCKAVDVLKEKLKTLPVLALPRRDKHCIFETDACDIQVGCLLSLEQEDNTMMPIGYWCRSHHDGEIRYGTTHKEFLAFVWTIPHFCLHLDGIQSVVWTDHAFLRWILDPKKSAGRLTQWRIRLMEFDFDVVH